MRNPSALRVSEQTYQHAQSDPQDAVPRANALRIPRILLLDDDVLFCRLMTKVGAKRNIPVISCQSIEHFRELARWVPYDVAIIDYYLDDETTAPEIAKDLHKATIVISNDEYELKMDKRWPSTVKISIAKALGISAILEAACAVTLF